MKFAPISREQLFATFREAFADYAVDMSRMTERAWSARCIKNNVDFDLSPGVFDGERMVVRIDSAARLPIRTGLVTFSLSDSPDGGSGATTVKVDYDFSVKPRFMAPLIGRMVEGQLAKGFDGFLADLDTAATETAAA